MTDNSIPYLCQWNSTTNNDQPICKINSEHVNILLDLSTMPEKIKNKYIPNMYSMFYPEEQTCLNPTYLDKLSIEFNSLIPVNYKEYNDNGDIERTIFVGFLQLPHNVIDSEGKLIPYSNRDDLLKITEFTEDNNYNFRCHFTKNSYYFSDIVINTYNFFNNKIRSYDQYYAFIGNMNRLNDKLADNTQEYYAEINRNTAINSPRLNMDNYNFSHGLTAFNNGSPERNLNNILNSITDSNNNYMEICCSTPNKPIGLMGIFVKGKVVMASCTDLYTEIGSEYKRIFDNIDYFTPAFSYSQLWKKHSGRGGDNCNNEIILIPGEITGIWVKEYAGIETKEDAQEIAKQLNVSLSIVSAWRQE